MSLSIIVLHATPVHASVGSDLASLTNSTTRNVASWTKTQGIVNDIGFLDNVPHVKLGGISEVLSEPMDSSNFANSADTRPLYEVNTDTTKDRNRSELMTKYMDMQKLDKKYVAMLNPKQ